jgi:hypothetical protein
MPNVRKRIERLERFLAPEPASNPYDAIKRLALQSLSTEDLTVLSDVIEQGKRECQWTEREWAAVKALSCAFGQEVQRAGYRSMAEFQRHGFGPASASRTTR